MLAGKSVITRVRLRLPRPWQPVLGYLDLRAQDGRDRQPRSPTRRPIFDWVCAIRRAKLPDPAVIGNAGSFFKNPVVSAEQCRDIIGRDPEIVHYPLPDGSFKLAAGWLIDACGWKGKRVGRAGVYEQAGAGAGQPRRRQRRRGGDAGPRDPGKRLRPLRHPAGARAGDPVTAGCSRCLAGRRSSCSGCRAWPAAGPRSAGPGARSRAPAGGRRPPAGPRPWRPAPASPRFSAAPLRGVGIDAQLQRLGVAHRGAQPRAPCRAPGRGRPAAAPPGLSRDIACSAAAIAASVQHRREPSAPGRRRAAAVPSGASVLSAAPVPNRRRNVAPSFCGLTGLARKSFMPATRQRSRVSAKASAVSATMGTVGAPRRAGRGSRAWRRRRRARGMCRSISTTSKRLFAAGPARPPRR